MPQTLADSLPLVLPHLTPALAAPVILPRIRQLAAALPLIMPAGFEMRLGSADAQVDLLQCIRNENDRPHLLAEHIESTNLKQQPAWARLRDFALAWSDPSTPLYHTVRDIWLEFDLDKPSDTVPIPSIFLRFGGRLSGAEKVAAIETGLRLLLGSNVSPVLLDAIAQCQRALPQGGALTHIGLMLSRSVEALRINVQRLRPDQVISFLNDLGWSAPLTGLEPLLERTFELVDHVTLCLDMGARLYPRLGMECTTGRLSERSAQLSRLLDELVAQNLSTPAKRDALLEWPGVTSPTTYKGAWLDSLIARTLVEPPDQFSVMGRRLSHIKLVYQPGKSLEAKGYIGFGELWVKPAAAEPDPIAALQTLHGTEGLPRADRVRPFKFPEDHGPHCEYQTEWWYYTGNLTANRSNGAARRFGYQLTFFRRILNSPASERAADSALPQLYFAHFAITDVQEQRHFKTERHRRETEGAGIAGASGNPFSVWIENWSVTALSEDGSVVRLQAAHPTPSSHERHLQGAQAFGLDLILTSLKPLVLQGNQGLSQKTDVVGNASYYLSFSRLRTEGTLSIHGETFTVQGLSWMDHEWGTTELGARAVGWDWFSIQLDDQREVMFYHIRNQDGSVEPLSSGTVIEADGSKLDVTLDRVELKVLETWKSGKSQRSYPARWRLNIPTAHLELELLPLVADQEMPSSHTYWEGAVQIEGMSNGVKVTGSGYVELTGYGGRVGGGVERWRSG